MRSANSVVNNSYMTKERIVQRTQHYIAFKEVKKLVVNQPVLKYYDCNEVTLQCDASKKGFGATHLQNGFRVENTHTNRNKKRANLKRMPCDSIYLSKIH